MKNLAGLALVLAGVITLPAGAGFAFEPSAPSVSTQLIAPGGGGGGSRGGGGGSRGGGSFRSGGGGGSFRSGGGSAGRANTGFSAAGSGLSRGSSRPSGGWSNQVRQPGVNPSLNRPSGNAGAGDRNLSRDVNRNVNRDLNRNVNVNRDFNRDVNVNRSVNANWNRRVNINNVNVNAGWARPGWGVARPWNYGWYGGWSTPTWGWWGARAATWGIATLATASIINSAVDAAISANQTYILVPQSNYQLIFASVVPTSSSMVSFAVNADGGTYQLTADCNAGLLDGRQPQSAAEAELLNAACQVAFGNV